MKRSRILLSGLLAFGLLAPAGFAQTQRAVLLAPIAVEGESLPPAPPTARGVRADERVRPVNYVQQPATLPNLAPTPAPTAPAEPLIVSSSLSDRRERRADLEFGAAFYLLRPFSLDNTAYRTNAGIGTVSPQITSTNFGWDYQPAFAVWLGYTGPQGLGGQARWFHFNQFSNTMDVTLGNPAATTNNISPSPNLTALPIPGGGALFGSPGLLLNSGLGQDALTFSSQLRIDTGDLEATYSWETCNWRFVLGAGARYLHLAQTYNATLTNNVGAAAETQVLNFTQNFNGGGPLLDFQANWRIGQTNLAAFANARGALLVGRSTQSTSYFQSVVDPTGLSNGGLFPVDSQINPSVSNITNNVIPVLDLEVGLEYGQTLGRARWFLRTAAVNQTYFGAGNASRTDGNLSMFGFQFTAGIDY